MSETCRKFHERRHRRSMPIACGRPVYADGLCHEHWTFGNQDAIASARDEVVRLSAVIASDIAAEHPDVSGYRVVNITERDAAAFCAAVANLAKLEGK